MIGLLPLAIGGVAAIWGLGAFAKANPPSTSTAVGSMPKGAASAGNQPAQLYPFQIPVSPRVDNSNQPWYAGWRSFSVGPADNYSVGKGLSDTSSIVQSLSDIWGNLAPGPSEATDFSNANNSVDSMPSDYVAAPVPYDSSSLTLGVDTSMPDGSAAYNYWGA